MITRNRPSRPSASRIGPSFSICPLCSRPVAASGNVGSEIQGAYGKLTLYADGHYTYAENANVVPPAAEDSFVYTIKDGDGDTSTTTLKITLTDELPPTTWHSTNAREYGFYSNVNPTVDHPRWSQATERRLGELFKRKTLMFNGYADQVASLYAGLDLKKFY